MTCKPLVPIVLGRAHCIRNSDALGTSRMQCTLTFIRYVRCGHRIGTIEVFTTATNPTHLFREGRTEPIPVLPGCSADVFEGDEIALVPRDLSQRITIARGVENTELTAKRRRAPAPSLQSAQKEMSERGKATSAQLKCIHSCPSPPDPTNPSNALRFPHPPIHFIPRALAHLRPNPLPRSRNRARRPPGRRQKHVGQVAGGALQRAVGAREPGLGRRPGKEGVTETVRGARRAGSRVGTLCRGGPVRIRQRTACRLCGCRAEHGCSVPRSPPRPP